MMGRTAQHLGASSRRFLSGTDEPLPEAGPPRAGPLTTQLRSGALHDLRRDGLAVLRRDGRRCRPVTNLDGAVHEGRVHDRSPGCRPRSATRRVSPDPYAVADLSEASP